MNMNMKKSLAWGSILLALGMSAAMAGPNVVNATQKGSLLVFPDIDTTNGRETVIRITNDNTRPTDVKCYYGENTGYPYYKPTQDFEFTITKTQPVHWSVSDGQSGSININAQPFENKYGELKCWAVTNGGEQPVSFNHLSGTATVFEPAAVESKESGSSYEYSASAAACRTGVAEKAPCVSTTPGSTPELVLDGKIYDQCPKYIIGSFTPQGGYVDSGRTIKVENNYLNVASCNQDLSPVGEANAIVQTIVFDMWNENEVKGTGARKFTDSWSRIALGLRDQSTDASAQIADKNPQNFTYAALKTDAAYFRAESDQHYGLIGELVRDYAGYDKSAVETSQAGLAAVAGSIKFSGGLDGVPTKN